MNKYSGHAIISGGTHCSDVDENYRSKKTRFISSKRKIVELEKK
jgi:hypothetical protein